MHQHRRGISERRNQPTDDRTQQQYGQVRSLFGLGAHPIMGVLADRVRRRRRADASQQTVVAGAYSSTFTANPFIQYDVQGATSCPTGAKTASTSSSATATVVSSCNVSATNINFGSIGLLTGNTDAQGTLAIQCNSTLPYTVSLDGGLSGATDPTQRKMSSAGTNITYGLYRDSARSLPWGNTAGVNTASATGTGLSQSATVYGRIAPQTTPQPSAYSDTLVVTVGY